MSFSKKDFANKLYKEVDFLKGNGKEESANFLVWFLTNYYRLDDAVATLSVCDHKNDKGIDGIYVDDDTNEVILFQAKYRKSFDTGEGDKALKEFYGSAVWFSPENLELLDNSRASKELKNLVKTLNVFESLKEGYQLRLAFITTGFFDTNGKEFIPTTRDFIEYWDNNRLYESFTYNGDDDLVYGSFVFHPTNKIIENEYKQGASSYIFTAKALELITLDGIVDRSLFSKNVRFGLGRTNVNKSIAATLNNPAEHKKFVLFHNGITIIAHKVRVTGKE